MSTRAPLAERFASARPRLLRLAYSQLGDLGEAARLAGRVYLEAEDVTVESMRPGDGGVR